MESAPMIEPNTCPRFDSCNAALCPIDPRWPEAVHLPGEKVCYYLLASGKTGAAERFAEDATFQECLTVLPRIAERHPEIRRTVERAALTGFQGNHLRRENRGRAKVQE